MDKMDRMLRDLPHDAPDASLVERVLASVYRRHRRRQVVRWSGVVVLGLAGLWQILPGLGWLSSSELYASSASWLFAGMDYLNYESLDLANRILSGALSAQNMIGASVQFSSWVGAMLLCCAIFLALGSEVWQVPLRPGSGAGEPGMRASSLHI